MALNEKRTETICVLGAGVIGVSTAFTLSRYGYKVIVVDKNEGFAQGASHANGAQLSYSYVEPFGNLKLLRSLPKYLLGFDPSIQLRPKLSGHYLSWGFSFLRNCLPERERENLHARATLSQTSAEAFEEFMSDPDIKAPLIRSKGKLILISNKQSLEVARKSRDQFLSLGLERNILDRDQVLDIEPALAQVNEGFVGAAYAPHDMAYDPVLYCELLAKACRNAGVEFQFNTRVISVLEENRCMKSVETSEGPIHCDAVVVCLGNGARSLAKPLGISLPIYPMQGYSLTLPTSKDSPSVSVTSLKHKLVYANLGSELRIAGFLDANLPQARVEKRQKQLLGLASKHWPGAADFAADPQHWTNYRPMTPSGVPIIGESKIKNLYMNVGHGSLGYTFAAGSAAKIAAMIGRYGKHHFQQEPQIRPA